MADAAALTYKWSRDDSVRAWEAGVRVEHRRGDRITVTYADTDLAVDDLLD